MGVSGLNPAAMTASGNLAAEAGARQHRGGLWGWGRWKQVCGRQQMEGQVQKGEGEEKEQGWLGVVWGMEEKERGRH